MEASELQRRYRPPWMKCECRYKNHKFTKLTESGHDSFEQQERYAHEDSFPQRGPYLVHTYASPLIPVTSSTIPPSRQIIAGSDRLTRRSSVSVYENLSSIHRGMRSSCEQREDLWTVAWSKKTLDKPISGNSVKGSLDVVVDHEESFWLPGLVVASLAHQCPHRQYLKWLGEVAELPWLHQKSSRLFAQVEWYRHLHATWCRNSNRKACGTKDMSECGKYSCVWNSKQKSCWAWSSITHSEQKTWPQDIEHGALWSWPNLSKQTSQLEPGPTLSILDQREKVLEEWDKDWKAESGG